MFRKKKKKDKEIKYEYCIENALDDSKFKAQCRALKDNLIDLIDDGVVTAEDGSPMQFYLYQDMEITVLYDIELEEVYVDSPIDLSSYIIE